MHLVKKINDIDGYKITITFNDKKTKVIDVEPFLNKGIFIELQDPAIFNQVTIFGGTLVWPNEADFCPDVLYEIGIEIPFTKQANKKGRTIKSRSRRVVRKKPSKKSKI
jgi:hypothetical protein